MIEITIKRHTSLMWGFVITKNGAPLFDTGEAYKFKTAAKAFETALIACDKP